MRWSRVIVFFALTTAAVFSMLVVGVGAEYQQLVSMKRHDKELLSAYMQTTGAGCAGKTLRLRDIEDKSQSTMAILYLANEAYKNAENLCLEPKARDAELERLAALYDQRAQFECSSAPIACSIMTFSAEHEKKLLPTVALRQAIYDQRRLERYLKEN